MADRPQPKPRSDATDAKSAPWSQRMRAGERRAIATAITELERLSPAAPVLLQAMQPYLGRALVVGFTGPPGAGKSTLVNAVIAQVRARGQDHRRHRRRPFEPGLRRRDPRRPHPHDVGARR